MTKLEILDEEIAVRAVHGRAYSRGEGCYYFRPGNPGCAVGRCLLLPDEQPLEEGQLVRNAVDSDVSKLDSLLATQYRGHDLNFWEILQKLHDDNTNWRPSLTNPRGQLLSEAGRSVVAELRFQFS